MTTLIKNVLVVDGSGQAPKKTDVLLRGPYIAGIGNFPSFKADTVIFGNEQFLSPGFIDVNVSSDRSLSLFSNPACGDFAEQGITAILLGQCGFSLAPSLYGELHSHHSREHHAAMNADWKSFADFLRVLGTRYRFGVHVGSLAGHRVMREDIVQDVSGFRRLSAEELRIFRHVVAAALDEGAFGLSTGLGYPPYGQTPYHELRALADIVAQKKGLYATHLRNETDELLASVQETVKLAQETNTRTIISHLRPFSGHEEQFEQAITLLERKLTKANVHFDINPFPYSAVRADAFLPKRMRSVQADAAYAYVLDEAHEKEILGELPHLDARNAVIFRAPDMPFLRGNTLDAFAQNRHVPVKKALLEFMRATKLRGALFYKNLNEDSIVKGLFSSQSLISTNSSHSGHVASEPLYAREFRPVRLTDTFPEFIRRSDALGIPIERAVAKITSLPASLLGLEKRGTLTAGNFADLTLFSKDGNILHVFVNGRHTVADGKLVPERANGGVVLRKPNSRG